MEAYYKKSKKYVIRKMKENSIWGKCSERNKNRNNDDNCNEIYNIIHRMTLSNSKRHEMKESKYYSMKAISRHWNNANNKIWHLMK